MYNTYTITFEYTYRAMQACNAIQYVQFIIMCMYVCKIIIYIYYIYKVNKFSLFSYCKKKIYFSIKQVYLECIQTIHVILDLTSLMLLT